MKQYQKINTLYRRYRTLPKDCPNPKWRKMQNKIIMGCYSDKVFDYLKDCLWEGYSKIDGTNSKICFFPSSGKIQVGGKTDKAESQHGQFEMLKEIADRIQPQLCKMFPPESAKFVPVCGDNKKPIYYDIWPILKEVDEKHNTATFETKFDKKEIISSGMCAVELEEVPIYIYGEYFGQGIQKCGGRYYDNNDFCVFDIDIQGWWITKEMRDAYCKELSLKTVPFIGVNTLQGFEKMVTEGFTTRVDGAKDQTLIEEGIVARPLVPIKDGRDNRIIVKIKHCDYNEYFNARKEFTDEEFKEFNNWYCSNVELIY